MGCRLVRLALQLLAVLMTEALPDVPDHNRYEIRFFADVEVHHDEEKYQAWLAAQAAEQDEKE